MHRPEVASGVIGLTPRRSDRFVLSSNRNRAAAGKMFFVESRQAISSDRDSNGFPNFQTAQTMRAILLATAVAALL